MNTALLIGGLVAAFLLVQGVTAFIVVQRKKGRGGDKPGG